MGKFHRDLLVDSTLKIEILNLRATRMDTRDILQDLQDVANGIQVTHARRIRSRRPRSKRRPVGKLRRDGESVRWSK